MKKVSVFISSVWPVLLIVSSTVPVRADSLTVPDAVEMDNRGRALVRASVIDDEGEGIPNALVDPRVAGIGEGLVTRVLEDGSAAVVEFPVTAHRVGTAVFVVVTSPHERDHLLSWFQDLSMKAEGRSPDGRILVELLLALGLWLRVLLGVTRGGQIARLTPRRFRPKKSRTGPRVSESRDTPRASPAMEVPVKTAGCGKRLSSSLALSASR